METDAEVQMQQVERLNRELNDLTVGHKDDQEVCSNTI
jgi:hypothetical protein